MAENKGSKATSSVKSGVVHTQVISTLLGGNPPKKDVDAIEKANSPKKAPGSVRA